MEVGEEQGPWLCVVVEVGEAMGVGEETEVDEGLVGKDQQVGNPREGPRIRSEQDGQRKACCGTFECA